MRSLAALLLVLFASAVAAAETDPAAAARGAIEELEAAAQALEAAETARDRVAALTETVRGFESGLAAMREGLRVVSIRERQLTLELEAREAEVARLLGALQSMSAAPAPLLTLHPSGPLGTARAGMLVADVTPALQRRAEALSATLTEVATLRALQQGAARRVEEGLLGVQTARTALSQAVAEREDLPRRFTADPVGMQILIAATETLEGFASGLSGIVQDETPVRLPPVVQRKGDLPLPVQGTVIRRAGEADAAGIVRPGIVVATRPRALVTTPAAATLRYRGPLLDYGLVSMLEPQAGVLFVLAGLDVVFGEVGEVLPEGSPVGLMGGEDPQVGAIVSQSGDGAGRDRSETLYMEVRAGGEPEDPLAWFRSEKD
ncbi:murein hydrolase activator EnvC [Rhodosalinus sp. 5P4]|uniref:murein hydrolase activator EnvC family protein n=1 Tax=Rhodosalinus sp. 5P4 TaxID=3239196 RepID=UPI0035235C08